MSVLKVTSSGNLLRKYKPEVDNVVFRLHYRVTFVLFFIASVMVTAKEFVGAPIQCEGKNKEIKGELLNTYCYIMSTFSLPSQWAATIGRDVAYPGVANAGGHEEETVFHTYYLWVPIVLFLQGVLFYIPHFIWKKAEGGVFSCVLNSTSNSLLKPEERDAKNKEVVKYMLQYLNTHQFWALG